MKWLYIVGIILSVAYVGIFWYDIIMDSHLNDLLEILVLFMYVLLAVRFHRFLQFRFSSVSTSEISDILLFIFPHLVVSLCLSSYLEHSLIPFMERENRDTIKPSLRIF